jgi:hypothetical protein
VVQRLLSVAVQRIAAHLPPAVDHTTPTGGPLRSCNVGATHRSSRRPRQPPTQSRGRSGAADC